MSDAPRPEEVRISRIFPTTRSLRGYFSQRPDFLTNLFLVMPLFVIYHVGVIALVERGPDGRYQWVGNGVDFLTGSMLRIAGGDVLAYGVGAMVVTLVLTGMILWARRRSGVHPRLFIPLLTESAVYSVLIAGSLGYVVDAMGLGGMDSQSFYAQVVSSCGAGLHEELVFRVGLFHGLSLLLERRVARPWVAWLGVAVATSALFSGVHYVGPLGDRFELASFAFRMFLGMVLAGIYRYRGFAVAAWTHTLYDVLYFATRRF
ncbi:MAG TPA: CPBP family intramembrane glutamic endopeptidase [Gemmatimonadaceae bacterium]|nr:CPBP family intramembrane glutamic endopeptidase [Gemmatimonadaceae bacterium]